MKQEIERKFMVNGDGWRSAAGAGVAMRQGYLSMDAGGATVRVRVVDGGGGVLTIKSPTVGISRAEMEYEIPAADAVFMIEHLCAGRVISKTRYIVEYAGARWEVDEFSGAHAGLVLAEIELESETQPVVLPDWVGAEVSHDPRYTNAALSLRS